MAEAGGTSGPVHFFRCRAMALFWKIPSQRQHVPTEGCSVMLGLHPGAWGSYRSSAWAAITMTSPKIAAIIFMVVHVFKLCGTVMPKYCVTTHKPESLTWENADPPAQRARPNSVGVYPGIPFTSGAAMPAAVMIATVADPCARRMAAAISHTTSRGENALVISRLPA